MEVESDMKMIDKRVVTSSPAKPINASSHDDSYFEDELTPVKNDKPKKDMSLSLRYVLKSKLKIIILVNLIK